MAYFTDKQKERIARAVKEFEASQKNKLTRYPVVRGGSGDAQTIIAKAAVESGSYPTLQAWCNVAVNAQQKVWQFQLGSAEYDEDVAAGEITYTAATGDYIKAFNKTGHYIPQSMLCLLHLVNGQWYAEYTMPLYVTGTVDSGISQGSNGLITLASGQQVTGKITGYDRYLGSGQTITSGKVVGCSLRSYFDTSSGSYYYRYDVTEVVC